MAIDREYLRSVLFGFEDSLVSTTGLIAGLAVGSDEPQIVLLGASVAIIIEAVSMGASEYLSDDAVEELDKIKRHSNRPLLSGLLMFGSYGLAGLVPLLPVVLLDEPISLVVSVAAALLGLFGLGLIKGRLLGVSPLRGALKMLIVGGLATFLGVIVGLIFRV